MSQTQTPQIAPWNCTQFCRSFGGIIAGTAMAAKCFGTLSQLCCGAREGGRQSRRGWDLRPVVEGEKVLVVKKILVQRFLKFSTVYDLGVSWNGGTPNLSIFSRMFHYKPSILGYPHLCRTRQAFWHRLHLVPPKWWMFSARACWSNSSLQFWNRMYICNI